MIIWCVCFFVFGLCVGSFSNVLIYRLPRFESINFPASHCQTCKKPLKFYHNIPLFSWIFLGGKCAFCRSKISIQYPLVELSCAFLALIAFTFEIYFAVKFKTDFGVEILIQNGFNIENFVNQNFFDFLKQIFEIEFLKIPILIFVKSVALGLCFIFLLALSIVDFRYTAVPDGLLYPATLFSLIYTFSFNGLLDAAIFAFGLWLLRFVVSLALKREAMGIADVYIAAIIGAILGIKLGLIGIYLAAIFTLPAYVIVRKRDYELPFVPFLALGMFLTYIFKIEILDILKVLYG